MTELSEGGLVLVQTRCACGRIENETKGQSHVRQGHVCTLAHIAAAFDFKQIASGWG